MTNSQREKLEGRLKKQVAMIEKVCAANHFSYQDLGERIAVTRDTIRKYAGGYQPASERVMELIAQWLPSAQGTDVETVKLSSPATNRAESAGSAPVSVEAVTLTQKLLYVLEHGTHEEGALLRAFVEVAHRNVCKRQPDAPISEG